MKASRLRKGRGPAARLLEALGALGILAMLVLLAEARSAKAHPPPTGPGVEIIKTEASAWAGHHLWPGGVAAPSHFLNLDTDNDGIPDAITVPAGTPVRLAVHVRDSRGDPNSTAAAPVNVRLTASGRAFFTRWSRVCSSGWLDADGAPDTCESDLFDGPDSQSVTAQLVSDSWWGVTEMSGLKVVDARIDVNGDSTVDDFDDLAGAQFVQSDGTVLRVNIRDGCLDTNNNMRDTWGLDPCDDPGDVLFPFDALLVLNTTVGPKVVMVIEGRVDYNNDNSADENDDTPTGITVNVALWVNPRGAITGSCYDNPDGMAIFEVLSATATDSTIFACVGSIGCDSVRIIWQEAELPVAWLLWGDVNCSGDVEAVDALQILRHLVRLPVLQQEPCPDIGVTVSVDGTPRLWGDVDGSGEVNAADALKILRHVAMLSVEQQPGTPPIGREVEVRP